MAVSEDLRSFIREALARGVPRPEIEAALLQAGWQRDQVAAGMNSYAAVAFPVPVPRPVPYVSAREAFLYLLLFSTLYISAWNLGSIAFQVIDLMMPDPARKFPDHDTLVRWLRFAIASLVVAAPVFLWLAAYTRREIRNDPTKAASKVRRGLTYLTLFVSALVVIGDLIALLNDLLNGALAVRFVLKVVVVGAIAGGAFRYYLADLRRHEMEPGM